MAFSQYCSISSPCTYSCRSQRGKVVLHQLTQQQNWKALVLWFGLVVLAGRKWLFKCKFIRNTLRATVIWCSGHRLVWFSSGLVLWQDQPDPSGFPDAGKGKKCASATQALNIEMSKHSEEHDDEDSGGDGKYSNIDNEENHQPAAPAVSHQEVPRVQTHNHVQVGQMGQLHQLHQPEAQ
jgi:hypothetical protein